MSPRRPKKAPTRRSARINGEEAEISASELDIFLKKSKRKKAQQGGRAVKRRRAENHTRYRMPSVERNATSRIEREADAGKSDDHDNAPSGGPRAADHGDTEMLDDALVDAALEGIDCLGDTEVDDAAGDAGTETAIRDDPGDDAVKPARGGAGDGALERANVDTDTGDAAAEGPGAGSADGTGPGTGAEGGIDEGAGAGTEYRAGESATKDSGNSPGPGAGDGTDESDDDALSEIEATEKQTSPPSDPCAAFQRGISALRAAMPDPTQGLDTPARLYEDLELSFTVFAAIAAVTEAIADRGHVLFSQLDPMGITQGCRVARPGHVLFLPYHRDLEPKKKSKQKVKRSNKKTKGHLALLIMSPEPDGGFIATHHDSGASCFESEPDKFWRQAFEDFLEHDASSWLLTDRPPDEPTDVPSAEQTQDWPCGMHTIFTAWAHALGLQIQPDAQIISDFYMNGVDLINFALHGLVASQLIYSFLACYGYTQRDSQVPESRKFQYTYTFLGPDDLTSRVAAVRLERELEELRNVDDRVPDLEELLGAVYDGNTNPGQAQDLHAQDLWDNYKTLHQASEPTDADIAAIGGDDVRADAEEGDAAEAGDGADDDGADDAGADDAGADNAGADDAGADHAPVVEDGAGDSEGTKEGSDKGHDDGEGDGAAQESEATAADNDAGSANGNAIDDDPEADPRPESTRLAEELMAEYAELFPLATGDEEPETVDEPPMEGNEGAEGVDGNAVAAEVDGMAAEDKAEDDESDGDSEADSLFHGI